MNDQSQNLFSLPPEQQVIRDKCFHPSGTFVKFSIDEIEESIPARFEKIVRQYPDRIAVKMGDSTLTYDELNKAANRIARAILDRRGPKQEPVIVLFDQGARAIAAILGVLKSRKFYVPVSPSFPGPRIAAILDDAEPGLLITDNKNVSVAHTATRNVLKIDELSADLSDENLSLSVSPNDLAYIIYTSGTTGKPKGVFQNQRNVLQWTLVHSNAIHICALDRLSLIHSHSTSGGTHRMWDTLLNGAALFPFDFRANGAKLAQWLLDERITIYQSGPLVFRQWIDALTSSEEFPDLRLIRLSGMATSVEDVVRFRRHFSPACVLVHVLGTSEAGTIPHYFIDKRSKIPELRLPVGYAVGHSKVTVVDENGRRADPEAVGEIVVQSRFLACGYWRNDDLTDQKFLSDPEAGEERLYLTGDLGRMSADGCLYHLGRKDFRVKIRGYSVEISEIEDMLRTHSAIKEVVVISGADTRGEPQLIAYFVPAIASELTASALRNYLAAKLPDYMVPSIFVSLPAMPLTPSGKIDRKALPSPLPSRPGQDAPSVVPRTPLEQELKKIWSEVLGLDDIGVLDNFFDLGGHSLRAAQILSRIQKSSHIEISLDKLFESPTIAALAEHIASARATSSEETFFLEKVARNDPLPLSFAQERLWFLDQLEPGSVRYNVALALLFTGRLDVELLKRCLNEIVKRHESLRTVITVVDGHPCQKVMPAMSIGLPVVDFGEWASGKTLDSAVHRFIISEAQRPFDLSSGPLIRSSLLSLEPERHILLLTLHHIAFDGWSGAIVLREIASLYADLLHRQSASLPDLRIQYSDYAVWQRRTLYGPVLKNLLAYWKKQLQNLPQLGLPPDRPRSTAQSCRGARKWFVLNATTTRLLIALSRQENATLFMLLLAAFQTLLHRYTAQTDIVTGTPIAGRRGAEIENLVGFFLNMLVLRVDLSGNPTFRELLARTRQTCLEAYAHEDLPFELLVEELKPQRSINQNPLFQVSFVLQNFPKVPFESAGIKAVEMDIDPGIARFDLHVFMTEEENGLKGYFEYNTDLFDAATIECMVGHFQTLLDGIVVNADVRISELPVLTESEKHQLLVKWNETAKDYPKDKCLHQLFEEQVKRTPDAVAAIFEDQQMTYKELNTRANQLGHYLQRLGVGPETLGGICVERSLEMVIGMLAILKAGGAYVPLDPSYPKDRLDWMLKDAKVGVLLTQQGLLEKFTQDVVRVICLDSGWEEISKESKENPHSEITAENLVYVIYTSGSAGQPKGAMIHHRGQCNRLHWMQESYQLAKADRVLQKTPFSFDVSVWEVFWPLITGARLVIARPGGHQDTQYLVELIKEQEISTLHFVPSMLQLFLEEPQVGTCKSLRQVICSGEALSFDLQKRFYDRVSAKLHNLYGPTEASIDVTYWECERRSGRAIVPIGRPIANAEIYILDPHLNPVPIGVMGELHIGGCGLARGYLNQPELTAKKFINHAFDGMSPKRLYKTGDRARYQPDGNIEFLGRIDDQVKIRGYRIELGEIEAVLGQHPAIRETVVLAREDSPGDERLVAYLVTACGSTPSTHELRSFLQQKLPDYMIPSEYMFLETMPLTPNGKVDRKALPIPQGTRPELAQAFSLPRTPTEELLVNIWAEVLKLERVGIHDNFFDLGGHSLIAARIVSRMVESFQVELPLRAFFQSPTISAMALIIAQK